MPQPAATLVDALAHLHGWHLLFAGWCMDDGRGRTPVLPAAEPARYPWANGPLIELADECTGKHYDWGIERIEAFLQTR